MARRAAGSPDRRAAHRPRTADAGPADPRRPAGRPADRIVPLEESPRHVAIIMDGNRRWARARGLAELEGHAAGVEAIRGILRHAVRRGVPVLTLYAFSRENWARSDDEVTGLFGLLEAAIRSETDGAPPRRASGSGSSAGSTSCRPRRAARWPRPWRRPPAATGCCSTSRSTTRAGPSSSTPSGHWRRAGSRPRRSTRRPSSGALYTAGLPDPDLVIRTGGEQRLSNFLIWQAAYAELYTSPLLWPDFDAEALDGALLEFASRTRRFGR